MENVTTASGAGLSNDLIDKVLASTEAQTDSKVELKAPMDTLVNLPAGFITPDGEVIKTAEVRELNGLDEEYIGKSGGLGKAFTTILSRAVVSVGPMKATEELLDSLLSGDRDALMLGIFTVTFGPVAQIPGYCSGCQEFKLVEVDVNRDVKTKFLVDAVEDRVFTVQGKNHEFLVALPNGKAQRELSSSEDKNSAEQTSILLSHTVLEIDGRPVISKSQVQGLSVMDRRAIADALSKRLPGPQFEDITLPCGDCEGEVVVPFSLGALFRF